MQARPYKGPVIDLWCREVVLEFSSNGMVPFFPHFLCYVKSPGHCSNILAGSRSTTYIFCSVKTFKDSGKMITITIPSSLIRNKKLKPSNTHWHNNMIYFASVLSRDKFKTIHWLVKNLLFEVLFFLKSLTLPHKNNKHKRDKSRAKILFKLYRSCIYNHLLLLILIPVF